jgi:hypothetical protein
MTYGSTQQSGGPSLSNILVTLQQGVSAINNVAKTMKSIFPSS